MQKKKDVKDKKTGKKKRGEKKEDDGLSTKGKSCSPYFTRIQSPPVVTGGLKHKQTHLISVAAIK